MKFSLLLAILILSACVAPTAYKINSVQIGMDKEEVISLIGAPGSISATGSTEYLNYRFSETEKQAMHGYTSPYYVRLVNGVVDSYGKTGDFDSTQKPSIKVEKDENIRVSQSADLFSELKKIKTLLDEGILTEKEYLQQKAKLLKD
jgi:outer membrane protein assembly factor BamE (lipoprotein component of BamABCDE complex)